jgi:hypothetical protein
MKPVAMKIHTAKRSNPQANMSALKKEKVEDED